MKLPKSAFVVSFIANAILLTLVLQRRPGAAEIHSGPDTPAPNKKLFSAPSELSATQLAAFQSGDFAQLKAAGVPDDVAHVLVAGRAYARYLAVLQQRGKMTGLGSRSYWMSNPKKSAEYDEIKEAETKADHELQASLQLAFPEVDFADTWSSAGAHPYLPPAAREKLARIEKDYEEIANEINSHAEAGLLFPSDLAKLKLLEEEKKRDIAAALSPAEWEELQLHESNTAQEIRSRFGDAIASEADYRKIFALRKAYDDLYPFKPGSSDSAEQRAAYAQTQAEIISVIGEQNYAAFLRDQDQDYKNLGTIAKRLELPGNTPDLVYATRDRYAAASQALLQNNSLSAEEYNAQFKILAENAHAELQATLGAEGAAAYLARGSNNWIEMLESRTAFSTNPKDAPIHSNAYGTTFRIYRTTSLPRSVTAAPKN